MRSEIKKHGAAEFLLQNVDTFLHHANNHLDASIDEDVITELTNASSPSSTSLKRYKKNKRKLIPDFSEEAHYLDDANVADLGEGYALFNHYQQLLLDWTAELDDMNNAPLHELNNSRGAEFMANRERLAMNISRIKALQTYLVDKILSLQEIENLEQLRQNA